MKNIFHIIALLTLLASCTKEIPFNGEEKKPRLVINSLITIGQPITAELGKTFFFLDNDGEIDTSIPEGLQVDLYVNDQHMGTMEHSHDSLEYQGDMQPILRQFFSSDYTPTEGDVIKIKAVAPGFEEATASTSALPRKPQCSIISIEPVSLYQTEQNEEDENIPWFWLKSYAVMTLEITDTDPGQTNYFFINGSNDYLAFDENYPQASITVRPTLNDPVFENHSQAELDELTSYYPFKDYTFTDALFENGSYRIQIPIDLIVNGLEINTVNKLQPKILLPVEAITKEYYRYLCSENIFQQEMEGMVEPQKTYSNVTHGYGIVGGHHADTLIHQLPVPLANKP